MNYSHELPNQSGRVRVRATFSVHVNPKAVASGYTDPQNPGTGMDVHPDPAKEPPYPRTDDQWDAYLEAEGVVTLTLSIAEAAEMAFSFPGGVWDYREGEYMPDHRTGVWRQATLHVLDHAEQVFDIADKMKGRNK